MGQMIEVAHHTVADAVVGEPHTVQVEVLAVDSLDLGAGILEVVDSRPVEVEDSRLVVDMASDLEVVRRMVAAAGGNPGAGTGHQVGGSLDSLGLAEDRESG